MHLTEDDLILHYYGELDVAAAARAGQHLHDCTACHESFTKLQRVLAAVEAAPPAEIADGFERTVWARLRPELANRRAGWLTGLVLSPGRLAWVAGIVLLVAAAFVAGRISERRLVSPVTESADAAAGLRERVLLADLGQHLDRSQMMLIELVSADPAGGVDLSAERARAEQLVADNRLYRQTATANGNQALAAVLDDLEQVLVDVAVSPDRLSAADFNQVRRRIDDKGLLLKVRVLSSEVQKQQRAQMRARAGQSS
jgi:hypothetical protein